MADQDDVSPQIRKSCRANVICIVTTKTKQSIHFDVESLVQVPFTVLLKVEQQGLAPGPVRPLRIVTEELDRTPCLTLAIPPTGPWSYSYTYSFHIGSSPASPDFSYPYSLPFRSGQTVYLSQGYRGEFSHADATDYAIDFKVSIGTEVLAARPGRVVGIRKDSAEGGPTRDYSGKENYVWIQHDDGTTAQYLHFDTGRVVVVVGERVAKKQLIGYSGCTGYCRGPHLHFHVSAPVTSGDLAYKTFPTLFISTVGPEYLDPARSYLVP